MAEISTIARPYAVAAYKLGKEQKALAKWSEMLGFATAVANNAPVSYTHLDVYKRQHPTLIQPLRWHWQFGS